jgi:phosphatidylglycerophosphate synthase
LSEPDRGLEPVGVPTSQVVILTATAAELPGAMMKIAGLTVLARALAQLGRNHAHVVLVTDGTIDPPRPLPSGVEVEALGPQEGAAGLVARLRVAHPKAAVTAGDLFRVSVGPWLEHQRQGAPDSDGDGGALADGAVRVADEETRRRCESLVFEDLLRGDLGFIARHVNKKISFRITRYVLCRLPVTPNQVTVGSALIGLLGCLLVADGRAGTTILGMVAAQLQSILDGCDGELARVRFQQSAIGEWLDTLMDDGLNLALVAAIAVGLRRGGAGAWAGLAGGAIVLMLLVYNLVSYRALVRQRLGGELLKIRWKLNRGRDMKAAWATPGAIGPVRRVVLTLGRRDTFVFGWMVLAIVQGVSSLRLMPFVLLWAFLVALPCFVTAIAGAASPPQGASEGPLRDPHGAASPPQGASEGPLRDPLGVD